MRVQISPQALTQAAEGDAQSIEEIIKSFEPVLRVVAAQHFQGPAMDDAVQTGRLTVWKCLQDYDGRFDADQFVAGTLKQFREEAQRGREETAGQGISGRTLRRYIKVLNESNGNHDVAVALVQKLPATDRMTRETAWHARSVLEGSVSIEADLSDDDSAELTAYEELFDTGAVAQDKTTGASDSAVRRAAKAAKVRAVLEAMDSRRGARGGMALRLVYGIDAPEHGEPATVPGALDSIAEALGCTTDQAKQVLKRARISFANSWTNAMPNRDEASEWLMAADNESRRRAGRI